MARRLASLLLCLILILSLPAAAFGEEALRVEALPGPESDLDDFQSSVLEVCFLDVGQGNSALITCDGYSMLIDGGSSRYSGFLYSYLKERGIRRLEYVIATHPDSDHIGGLSGALNYADAGITFCTVTEHDTEPFRDFQKYLEKKNNKILVPDAGDRFSLGAASVEFLSPRRGEEYSDNTSLVTRVALGDCSFLFMGDAEFQDENYLINSGAELRSTVLAVGHHGSASSSSLYFLNEVQPQYAVISVGADNSYGHPSDEVLKDLTDLGASVLRTDENGSITFLTNGESLSVKPEKGPVSRASVQTPVPEKEAPAEPAEEEPAAAPAGTVLPEKNQASYVLNTKSGKIHLPGCRSVSRISEKNRSDYTGSIDDLLALGYKRCKVCNP